MKTLKIDLPGREYDILIGTGLLDKSGELLAPLHKSREAAIVTDATVWELYGGRLSSSLSASGFSFTPIVLEPGEQSKSLESLSKVYSALAKSGLKRDGLLIAFGGGVPGDLCGYAAATYMRGVAFVQIPTTLLAQVDSSVGGKTAVNLPEGKNLVGAFYQPKLVIADTDLLSTLSQRDFSGGMAEVIKYGAIASLPLFEKLEMLSGKPTGQALEEIICECCDIKQNVVLQDELDRGLRMILNFGHTFGHGIEKMYNYTRYTHGEATAIGMLLAAHTGELLGITPMGTEERLKSLISAAGLPVSYDFILADLLPLMQNDKKNESGAMNLILLSKLGNATVNKIKYHELAQLLI